MLDAYSWTEHASYDGDPAKASYGRYPDGTGGFQDFAAATKGTKNKVVNPVVINEVQSNDPGGGPDWVELANPTAEALDLSGLVPKRIIRTRIPTPFRKERPFRQTDIW